MVDASRTGACLHLPIEKIGLSGTPTLVTVARRLAEVLPAAMVASFDPARLGALVVRRVEIVRVGLGSGRDTPVELGCAFERPLTEVEAAALGLAVPPVGAPLPPSSSAPEAPVPEISPPEDARTDVSLRPSRASDGSSDVPTDVPYDVPSEVPHAEPPACDAHSSSAPSGRAPGAGLVRPSAPRYENGYRRGAVVEPRTCRPSRRFQAHVVAQEGQNAPPLVALTDRIDRAGVVLLVLEGTVSGVVAEGTDPQAVTLAFCEAYGHRVQMRVVDNSRQLWSGAVQLRSVEMLPNGSGSLYLDFRYAHPLAPAELRDLGVSV